MPIPTYLNSLVISGLIFVVNCAKIKIKKNEKLLISINFLRHFHLSKKQKKRQKKIRK